MAMNQTYGKVFWLTAFALAMGFLETAVVVYARRLLFPEGFAFPMPAIDEQFVLVELFREVATVVMLVGAGYLAGRRLVDRFAWFIYAFAIWDLAYYLFLYLLLDWPSSLMTWDLLFLVPVPWVGPVIAPVIVSVGLILLSSLILYFQARRATFRVPKLSWLLLVTGAMIIIYAMSADYANFIFEQGGSWSDLWVWPSRPLFAEAATYVPRTFAWAWFSLGMSVCALGIAWMIRVALSNRAPFLKKTNS